MATEEDRTEAYLTFTSFNYPSSIFRVDLAIPGAEPELWEQPPVPVDPAAVEVEQVWYRSKDGTRISMFLVHRKGMAKTGKVPTILYNRMIHPLLDVPIKGVIWYQGESNANNMEQATEYRRLFSAMISSWRQEWRGTGGRDFPFLWVQLPNFGRVDSMPPETATWATVRESQAAALALPNTGQVVAIDLGGADELHPRNKKDVGARLALKAREVAYGERVASSGPTYQRHTVGNGRVTIELANIGGGLVSRSTDGRVPGFSVAASDGRFVWANARIEGNRVVVWSDRVAEPVAVRYLWSNSPRLPVLYNREGLPAAPFRTDSW